MHQLGQAVKIYFLWFVIIFFIQMVRRVCEDFFFLQIYFRGNRILISVTHRLIGVLVSKAWERGSHAPLGSN